MIKGSFIDKYINEPTHFFNKRGKSSAILITCDDISCPMVIKNRALHACQARIHTVFTVLLKSVRFFIIDVLSCKASSEEKELAKLSCLNDSETQERGLWEVKIEENFPLGHAPGPPQKLFKPLTDN